MINVGDDGDISETILSKHDGLCRRVATEMCAKNSAPKHGDRILVEFSMERGSVLQFLKFETPTFRFFY